LARRDTRPAVKAEAFTVMAFMVTADIVVFGVVVGVCDGRGSDEAGARGRSEKPDARTDQRYCDTPPRVWNGFWCAFVRVAPNSRLRSERFVSFDFFSPRFTNQ